LGALAFQYAGDLAPCPLCIRQRYPHGFAIALAALSLALPPKGARIALALAGLSLLAGIVIGIDHAGIEYGWWPGSAECTPATPAPGSLAELNAQLASPAPPRCDAPAWTLFGVSLAGYNVLFSAPLAALALGAARKGRQG
jgi:disulfide bond formation protein DsbB